MILKLMFVEYRPFLRIDIIRGNLLRIFLLFGFFVKYEICCNARVYIKKILRSLELYYLTW